MISKGPSGLRRAGFGGSPPYPPSSSQSRLQAALPGSHGRGSGPGGLQERVFQKWAARGRVPGRLTARGRSLFFGKALWPALETALDGVGEGRGQCGEEAEAGRGSPQLQPFFPGPPAATQGAPGGVPGGGVWWEQEPGHSHCASFGPRPQGCSRPRTLPSTKEGEASSLTTQPHREATAGRRSEARPHTGGHPARSKPGSQSGPVACPL